MHRKQRDRMRVKNQKFQKNSRSKSQTTKSKKSEAEKSASQRKPNCPIRNESQHSGQRFWSESSDKVLSSRELRPNIQTIYHRQRHQSGGMSSLWQNAFSLRM